MVARPGTYQASCNAGELAPELQGNTGLKQYFSGLAFAQNIEPVPQGGFDLLPRSRLRSIARRALSAAWSWPAFTTVSISTADTLQAFTFPSPIDVSVVDLEGFTVVPGLSGRTLSVDLQDATTGAWVRLGGLIAGGATAATRRFGCAPGAPMRASSIRIALSAAPVSATYLSATSITVYTEATSGVPTAKVIPFTVSRDIPYVGVFTNGHVDFFRSGAFMGCCAHPYSGDMLLDLNAQQRDETMLLEHISQPTSRILRNGVDYEWITSSAPFTHVPQADLGGAYVNIAEKWQVWFKWASGTTVQGQDIAITVDGEESAAVKIQGSASPDWPATAALLKTAIEDLAAVEPGVTVAVVTTPAPPSLSQSLTVEFTGSTNPGNKFSLTGRAVSTTDMSVTCSRLVKGKKGGEDLWSVLRGYAATGAFYQQRFILGGFNAKRGAFAMSRPGEYFDFNIELESAAGAILEAIDTDGAERIVRMARGRHLVIFTDAAEYYISDRVISRSQPLSVVHSSSIGCASRVPVVEQEGALLFVSRERSMLYAHTYSDQAQAYLSDPISLLAPHLIRQIKGAALQISSSNTDAQRLWLPRDDGLLVTGLLIRNQDIVAFVRWVTDGLVVDVCVDGANVPHILVQRQVAGQAVLMLETIEEGLLFDAAIEQTFGSPQTSISGLAMHEGAQVWAVADGYVEGPFTVAGGAITLANAATNVVVGRWTAPDAIGMPLTQNVAERIVVKRPIRIHTIKCDLIGTQSLAVGANNLTPKDQPLWRMGDAVDTPFAGYSGQINITGLQGFSAAGQWRITQTRPGRLQVRNITVEARL